MRPLSFLAAFFCTILAANASIGLEKLTATQRDSLEKQIAQEVALARSGNVTGFSKPFSARRTSVQKAAAGLDQLTHEEMAAVDAHIAQTLQQRPSYSYYSRTRVTPTSIETEAAKAKISGQVSLTYGTDGHGRNFYGSSLTTLWESPSRKTAIAVTLARYRGDGFFTNSSTLSGSSRCLLR